MGQNNNGVVVKSYKAVINWKYLNEIVVFDEPKGQSIKTVKNDSLNEDYLSVIINEESEFFFRVKIYLEINGDTTSGWIEKKDYVGAIMKKEKFPMNVTLYSKPKECGNNLIDLKDWNPSFVTIDKCDGDWVLITIPYKGERKSGWIKYDRLCANNYSTCS
jgi:hypothetical protein